jgi:DNA repair protein RadC
MLPKKKKKNDSDTGTCQESDPTSIGRLLLRLGRINSEQLSRALASQAQVEDALLGAMLKQLGFVNDMDVALAMKIQAEMRSGRRMEAELDVLQSKVDETEAGARELSQALVEARRRRRERGEESRVTFLTPRLAAAAGRM